MPSWTNPAVANARHLLRHPEIVVIKDRDVMAFWPDTALFDCSVGMNLYRDSAKASQLYAGDATTVKATERILCWSRLSGTVISAGYRWVPYITTADPDDPTAKILPLREVYAPRVIYDRSNNALHLWFWTNVQFSSTATAYSEAELFPSASQQTDNSLARRVLCYAVGSLQHCYVAGGLMQVISPDLIPAPFLPPPPASGDETFDIVPIFNQPQFITNGSFLGATPPGIAADIVTNEKLKSFECYLDGSMVHVRGGTIRMHGIGNTTIADGDVTLTGTPEWVYAYCDRGGGGGGIDHLSSEPESTTTTLMVPLAKYTANGAGIYQLDHTCWDGDVNLDTPIR